jgi:hypothetical protein
VPKPEDLAPGEGRRVELSADQLRFIQLWAAARGAAGISIEDRGQGYLAVAAWDKSSTEVGRRTVFPLGNEL